MRLSVSEDCVEFIGIDIITTYDVQTVLYGGATGHSQRNASAQIYTRRLRGCGIRWAGHVVRMCEERWVYRVLVGKAEGKRPLGRPRRR